MRAAKDAPAIDVEVAISFMRRICVGRDIFYGPISSSQIITEVNHAEAKREIEGDI